MIKISGQSPAPGSKSNDIDTLISFVIEKDSINSENIQVSINGEIAFKDLSFSKNFLGAYSNVVEQTNSVSFTFDPTFEFKKDQSITIRINYKDTSGSDSKNYAFRTVTDKPILYYSNLSDGKVVTDPIVFRLEFVDELDGIDKSSINIKLNEKSLVTDGVLEDFLSLYNSKIEEIDSGYGISLEHQDFFRDDNYNLKYEVKDSNGVLLSDIISFSVKVKKVVLPQIFPSYNFVGFVNGLKKATPLIDGTSVTLEWADITPRVPKSEVFYLVFHTKTKVNIFDEDPKYLALKDKSGMTIRELDVGDSYYFAVRSLESFKNIFDFSGMEESESEIYKIPEKTQISSIFETDSLQLEVSSVDGYPDKGLLLVAGSEVVRYTSVNRSTNTFNIPENGRGLNSTTKVFGVADDEVKMFLACQDKNKNIIRATPMYQDGYDSGREVDNIGILVTDYSDNDRKFFQGYDYCGYHQAMPKNTLTGIDDCPSYLGGEFNGNRGMNLYDRMLNREELLLEQVGEPCVLLRRKWSGQMCDCMNSRSIHPKDKVCNRCYGTGYLGGFDQYVNNRRIDQRVLIRFKETAEDLELHVTRHMSTKFEPSCWTLPIPAIKDRDIIIRFDYTDDLEYFYEVLDTSKEKLIFGHYGRQNLRLKRLDKTDLINTFPFIK